MALTSETNVDVGWIEVEERAPMNNRLESSETVSFIHLDSSFQIRPALTRRMGKAGQICGRRHGRRHPQIDRQRRTRIGSRYVPPFYSLHANDPSAGSISSFPFFPHSAAFN
jgi:hypothetical protein